MQPVAQQQDSAVAAPAHEEEQVVDALPAAEDAPAAGDVPAVQQPPAAEDVPAVQQPPVLEQAVMEVVQEQQDVAPALSDALDVPQHAPAVQEVQPAITATENTSQPAEEQPEPTLQAVGTIADSNSGVPALISIPVAFAVALSAPIVLWSEATLRATGCGLEPGPGGLLGAIEGVSYLVVFLVALAGVGRLASSRGDRTGDVGILGAAEAVSWLTLGVGVLVLLWQVKEFGYLPGAVPDARCFPDQVDVVFDPSAANWAALGRLLRGTIGL